MKGEEIIDIVDTGKDSRIKITDVRGTQAMVSRQPKAVGTHKSREADDGKAPKGVGTDGQAERPILCKFAKQVTGKGREPIRTAAI